MARNVNVLMTDSGGGGARRNGGDNTTPSRPRTVVPTTPKPTTPITKPGGSGGGSRNNRGYTDSGSSQRAQQKAQEELARRLAADAQRRAAEAGAAAGRAAQEARWEQMEERARNMRDTQQELERQAAQREQQRQIDYRKNDTPISKERTNNRQAAMDDLAQKLRDTYLLQQQERKNFVGSVFQNLLNLQGKPTNLDNPGLPEPYGTLNLNNPPSATPSATPGSNVWPNPVDISDTVHPEDRGIGDAPRTDPNYPNYYRWGTDYGAGKYFFYGDGDDGSGDGDDGNGGSGGSGGSGGGHGGGGGGSSGNKKTAAYDIATILAHVNDAFNAALPQGFDYSWASQMKNYVDAQNQAKASMDQTAERVLNNWDDKALPTLQAMQKAWRLSQSGNTTGASRGVQAANAVQGTQTSIDSLTKGQQELFSQLMNSLMQQDAAQANIPNNVANMLNQINTARVNALGQILGYYLYGDVASANNNNMGLGPNDITNPKVDITNNTRNG